jgi:hypothetical protein
MRREQDQSQARWRFGGVTRNRAIGGAMVLAGIGALISFMGRGHLVAVIAAAGLLMSSLVFITEVVTTETARDSVKTLRAWQRIASNAGTESAVLEAQLPVASKDTGLMQVLFISGPTPLVWTTQERPRYNPYDLRSAPGRNRAQTKIGRRQQKRRNSLSGT